MWHIYTIEYYSALKNEIMPFVATWIDLEIITLSKVSQRQISYNMNYMWNLKKNWYKRDYLQNRNRHIDIENKFMVSRRGEE